MTPQAPRAIDWVMLGSLCMAWGFAFLLIAIGLKSFPPLTLVTLRLIVGALVLYLIMRWQGLRLPADTRWWLRFVVLTLLGNLVPFTLISWGQLSIASSQAGLLMALRIGQVRSQNTGGRLARPRRPSLNATTVSSICARQPLPTDTTIKTRFVSKAKAKRWRSIIGSNGSCRKTTPGRRTCCAWPICSAPPHPTSAAR